MGAYIENRIARLERWAASADAQAKANHQDSGARWLAQECRRHAAYLRGEGPAPKTKI